ncbi:28255_t:CDS:2, partial [Racocetra persica]
PQLIFSRTSHVLSRNFSRYYTSDAQKIEAVSPKRIPRARRALFYGSEERKIKSSLNVTADSIVYDLEDGVAFNRKGIAREMVVDALGESQADRKKKYETLLN